MQLIAQQHDLGLPYQISPKTRQEIWEVWTGMTVTEPIFMQLIVQQHDLGLPYQISPKTGQEIWEVWTDMTVTEPIFMKLTHARHFFLMHYYIKFHENLTNSFVADTRSQTNRMTEVPT
jgi:hypothetical protein